MCYLEQVGSEYEPAFCQAGEGGYGGSSSRFFLTCFKVFYDRFYVRDLGKVSAVHYLVTEMEIT